MDATLARTIFAVAEELCLSVVCVRGLITPDADGQLVLLELLVG